MSNSTENLRDKYVRVALVYFVFVLILRLIGGKYVTNFVGQPMVDFGFDYIWWVVLLTRIPDQIISSYFYSLVLDISIFILPILSFIYIKKRWLLGLTLAVFLLQVITVEVYTVSHSKSVICLFLVLIPGLFKNKNFLLMADFAKYYGASVLVSASTWKILNGAAFTKQHYVTQLINQYTDRAIMNPNHYLYQISLYLVNHPVLADILFKILVVTQLGFIVTYFTRKFDRLLILLLFGFSLTTWIFMGIYNFDIFILFVPLWFSLAINEEYNKGSVNLSTIS